jgi:hypothetical protein
LFTSVFTSSDATLNGSDADVLAVINAGVISPTSGRVVLFSDTITTPELLGDLLLGNEVLILNGCMDNDEGRYKETTNHLTQLLRRNANSRAL